MSANDRALVVIEKGHLRQLHAALTYGVSRLQEVGEEAAAAHLHQVAERVFRRFHNESLATPEGDEIDMLLQLHHPKDPP